MSPFAWEDDIVQVERGPEPGGLGGAYRAFGETLRGLRTTFGRLAEGHHTIQYPEEKTPVYPRFRGRHKLQRFDDTGLEKCVGCSLCAAACFLGGWHGPGPDALGPLWMFIKLMLGVVFFIWIRASLPRLRYDQLMSFGWKILLPLATLNVLATATVLVVT